MCEETFKSRIYCVKLRCNTTLGDMDNKKEFKREKLVLPNEGKKLLLHSCCAPCSGEVMEALIASDIDFTIYFYNPNIHPRKEYEIRKEENKRFAEKHNIPFIDADYDVDHWFELAKGMEFEPERGIRCTMCFEHARLKKPPNTRRPMALMSSPAPWVFRAGKIWNKSTTVACEQHPAIQDWNTGPSTGAKKEVPPECWKSASERNSTCRNTADAPILCETPTNGV